MRPSDLLQVFHENESSLRPILLPNLQNRSTRGGYILKGSDTQYSFQVHFIPWKMKVKVVIDLWTFRDLDFSRVVHSRPVIGPFATRYFSHLFDPSRFATSVIFAVCRLLTVNYLLTTSCIRSDTRKFYSLLNKYVMVFQLHASFMLQCSHSVEKKPELHTSNPASYGGLH